jgi:hypothetical protein
MASLRICCGEITAIITMLPLAATRSRNDSEYWQLIMIEAFPRRPRLWIIAGTKTKRAKGKIAIQAKTIRRSLFTV